MMNHMEIPFGNGGMSLLFLAAACDTYQSATFSCRRFNT